MKPFDAKPVRPKLRYEYAVEANRGWFEIHGVKAGASIKVIE